jgi:hypothetical protein
MSQGTQMNEEGIKAQVDQLCKLANDVSDLKTNKENAEDKREKREQKNQAFNDVHEAISDAENEFSTLQQAVNLAEVLDTSVPRDNLEDVLNVYRPQIRSFRSKTYDEFEDVSDISTVRTEFKEFSEAINDHKETVKSNLTAAAASELSDLETLESILRIPDVGSKKDSDTVQTYKSKLQSVNRGQLIDANELRTAQKEYSAIDIDIETVRENYGLSEDAGDLLLRFLGNEAVTLADVDKGVLDELKALEEFSKRLTIQF